MCILKKSMTHVKKSKSSAIEAKNYLELKNIPVTERNFNVNYLTLQALPTL